MKTPNLDATGHQWVGALARFNFQLEYQKGWDNMVADALSQVTTCLDPEAVQSILDGDKSLGPTHTAFSMRVASLRPLYAPFWLWPPGSPAC